MGDLISRSSLIKMLETYKFGCLTNEVERDYIKETMIEFVKTEPTAYDVEKVVSGVHNYFYKIIDDCNAENIPHEILKYNKEVCDIVRKGGVDD